MAIGCIKTGIHLGPLFWDILQGFSYFQVLGGKLKLGESKYTEAILSSFSTSNCLLLYLYPHIFLQVFPNFSQACMMEFPPWAWNWAGPCRQRVWLISAIPLVSPTLLFQGTHQGFTCPPLLKLGMVMWLALAIDTLIEWYALYPGRSFKSQQCGLSCFLPTAVFIREAGVKMKPFMSLGPWETHDSHDPKPPAGPHLTCRWSRK